MCTGVNFINVLRADPKSAKRLSIKQLLGSARVKAARRTLVKLTPEVLFSRVAALLLRLKKLKILEPNYGDEGRKVGSSFRISVIAGFSCIIGPTLICGFLFSMGANFRALPSFLGKKVTFS